MHGEMTGACSAVVIFDDENTPIGVGCEKDGVICWVSSREDLVFNYVTRNLQEKLQKPTTSDSQHNPKLVAEVDRLEARIAKALLWIEGDLRDVIRQVDNAPHTFNDLYECADKIEAALLGQKENDH
ncbi:hypothetical protein MELB17_10118 [Marinobacter sp. ELB17]|nr:hypothetical protein MELB17_10118 [Marinobacter sp. ELB17]